MAVYVDELRKVERTDCWPYDYACHMTADTPAELDDMAQRLGLRTHWKQRPGTRREHFDLTPGKQVQAVAFGAVQVTARADAERRLGVR